MSASFHFKTAWMEQLTFSRISMIPQVCMCLIKHLIMFNLIPPLVYM